MKLKPNDAVRYIVKQKDETLRSVADECGVSPTTFGQMLQRNDSMKMKSYGNILSKIGASLCVKFEINDDEYEIDLDI